MYVMGTPAPQGSKKYVGRGVMVESSKKVAPWREAVVTQAQRDGLAGQRLDGPLVASMAFYFPRPKGHFGTGRNADVLKPGAPARPTGAPDLSKLIRSTEDALTQAAVIVDDARIVSFGHDTGKYYCDNAHPIPGALIEVWQL